MMRAATGLLLAATLLSPALAHAEAAPGGCADGVCRVTLTADQLLAKASELVEARKFDEARPMVAALANVPALAMETHFLNGYIAVETGDAEGAVKQFRAALVGHPEQTRIRLELAHALMLQGKRDAADYNFRLAQQDASLPPEIQATIRGSRGLLSDSRSWHMGFDFGLAPDSNITNGTNAETIDLTYGNQTIPLTLGGSARARSGIGQTADFSAGLRHHVAEKIALTADIDAHGVNYRGVESDDYTGQLAIGPEFALSDTTTLSFQGIASQRYYGGVRAATQFGTRIGLERQLDDGQRIGLTLDARHAASGINADYSGWSTGLYATYERVVLHRMVASASLFARADSLTSKAYSNQEFGVSLGIGGELTHGINAGISGGLSRAAFDQALLSFSPDPRLDWRYNARIYAGLRSLRVIGFSPSVTYSFSRNDSSLPLYASQRSRFAFSLARYF